MHPLIDFAEWREESLVVHIHAIAAVLAFGIGAVVMLRRKGTRLHLISGRVFAGLLVVVLVTSMFIHRIELWGIWSPIHLLTLLVTGLLIWAIRAVRRGDIAHHQWIMEWIYLAGFVLAGGFTLLPDRLMGEVFLKRSLWALSGENVAVAEMLSLVMPALGTLVFLGFYARKFARWQKQRASRQPSA